MGSILSEDGIVKFDFITSLKKIAVAKVASLLWMSRSTQQELVSLSHSSESMAFVTEWLKVKDDTVAKVPGLCLPKTITMMLKKAVQALGDSILDWIEYHDRLVLKIGFKNSKYSSANLISHITWTDRGRIDFAKTAKNILANQNICLNDDQKYKIACTYCLEDEIFILASKVLNQDFLDSIDVNIFPLVHYWTRYVTGDNIKLYNHYNDDIQHIDDNISIIEYLKILTSDEQRTNMMPVTYMWNMLSEQEKTKNVASLFHFDNQDLQYSLLSNLDYRQQQDVFKECSIFILVDILRDWLYEEYFLEVALHVLEIINPITYYYTLLEIIDKMRNENDYLYEEYKGFFKKLWQNASRHLKDPIFDNNLVASFLCLLSWERDLDIIDLIINYVNNVQKRKKIFLDNSCMEICSLFILNEEWDSLELFMNHTLSSEEDRIEFKETLARYHARYHSFFIHLLDEAYDKIKRFTDWAFKSEEEMDHFRQSLVSQICLGTFVENDKVDFTKLENCLTWCANGDLELINKFKSEILIKEPYFIKKLIKENKYEFLDQILNWCYLGNQQQIAQFKCNIAGCDDDDAYVHDDDDAYMHDDDDDAYVHDDDAYMHDDDDGGYNA